MKKTFLVFLALISLLGFSSCGKKNEEEKTIQSIVWEEKEIEFYFSNAISVVYTDGTHKYKEGGAQMLDSPDGTKRLYVDIGAEAEVRQDGETIYPTDSFSFEYLDRTHGVALYTLDKSKTTTLHYNDTYSVPAVGYRWVGGASRFMEGVPVELDLDAFLKFKEQWELVSIQQYQPSVSNIFLSWKDLSHLAFIYESGITHQGELWVKEVMHEDLPYLLIEDYRDYQNPQKTYYKLSEAQWTEMKDWIALLPLMEGLDEK